MKTLRLAWNLYRAGIPARHSLHYARIGLAMVEQVQA